MSPVTKIALRRIKKNGYKSLLLIVAVLFSMLMISFFVFFELQTLVTQDPDYIYLPFADFIRKVNSCMSVAVVSLVIITAVTVRIYCSVRGDENKEVLAVLTSVGATNSQKRKITAVEITVLFLPSTVIGISLGMIPAIYLGTLFTGGATSDASSYVPHVILALILIVLGMLLISVCYILPSVSFKRRSVIQSVKRQNIEASEEKHSYRKSYTFRNQALIKRLAKKSTGYYKGVYNNISLIFASSAMYPLLAIFMFWKIGESEVVLDINPYDAIDTSAVALAAIDKVFVFLGVCFLVLTCAGIMQAVFMARMQYAKRKESARIYLAVGMPDSDIKKMIFTELRSVLLKAFICVFIAGFALKTCFDLFAGFSSGIINALYEIFRIFI